MTIRRVLLSCILVAACAQPPQKDTVRICDAGGCNELPRSHASHDPAATNDEDDGRLAALEALAERDPRAAYDLGLRYFRGDGVRQDSYKALTWMRSAAERGHLDAQKALGRLYLTGLEEMGSDPREAEKWLSIAASRGDDESGKLLSEASAAKKSDEAYFKWRERWRGVFYDNWYRRYSYLGYWRHGYWYYR
ncbi:MAG: sel1 repeat family protein [Azoarcus sp.]|nr:sel1 repeat family protein [Azoarcus sp.]